ncbi:MAG: type II secretion system protein [Clostridiaceae bacterium]|nr:type II secretion system protein [Clostridiaceae bacterium]
MKKAFTLIEILAVTALCGILIVSSAISLNKVWQNNQIDVCESELREIVNGFKSYFVDYGNIVISDDTNYETVLSETLNTLNRQYLPYEFAVDSVADNKRSASLASKLKTDPWNGKFKIHIYTYDGEDKESTSGLVVVSSNGVDTKSNLSTYKDNDYGDDIVAIIEPN